MDSQTLEGAPAAVLVDLERDNVEGDDETQTPESGKNQGTTSLNRHWPKCDKIKYADIGQVMIDMQACTTEDYICLTAHYVDSNWNLKTVMGDDGERDGGRFQPTTTTSTEAYGVYDLDVDED
ncbi:hypothetical protein P8452_41873 [Trifolium repens]|nr:hypothetical protein P8452_41873 [Trifolium repens]